MNAEIDFKEIDTNEWQDKIGGGGFSIVYRGTFHGTPVALKRWFDPTMTDELLQDFTRETMTHRSLVHPHVVQFLGACRTPPNLVMMTEYMQYSLQDVIYDPRLSATLTRERILDMAVQITNAFRYLHSRSPPIIHRDIKPANFLLDRAFKVKVCDFGLASATAAQRGAGTPHYMAPELLQTDRPYTRAVDVWAFGVLLHEMLTKTQPFLGLEPREIVARVLGGGKPDLDRTRVPSDLEPLLLRCWEWDPSRRPTFDELGAQLRDLLKAGRG